MPKSSPDVIYVGLNERDPAWHDLYKINLNTGEKELLKENTQRITGWIFDLKDNLRLAVRSNENGETEIMKVTDSGFETIYTCGLMESCAPIRYHKDGKNFYMVTNKGSKLDKSMLVLFNENTEALSVVEVDPENRVDFGGPIFSPLSDELVGTSYTDAKTRFYWQNEKYEKAFEFLNGKFPNKEVRLFSLAEDESKALVSVFSDKDPGSVHLFDWSKMEISHQYTPRPEIPIEEMAEMKPITYKSYDGLEIPAYLTLPKGKEAKNLPLVINPHGGPWARDNWGYDASAQFLANRGYAVLQPNFRGSTGFGKKFLDGGNQEWGQKMQDDLTAGAQYLIEQGIVDKEKISIYGVSYGGYATLAGLTFTPEVYACGVSVVGPSNLKTLLGSIPPYWESIKKMFYVRMGDPNTKEGEAILRKQSPLYSANKIQAPLMVVQGANDPRVKQTESDQIVVACRDLELPVEYIVAPDEGHGFRRPVNSMALYAAIEQFLAKHLGGRYQKEMPQEVSTRLETITVDVNTVTLPKELEANTLFDAPPMPEMTLQPREDKYKVTIEMAGQSLNMDMSTTIVEEGDALVISDKLSSPMGNMADVTYLDKKTLQPIKREVEQGIVKMNINYSEKLISGDIMMPNGKQVLNKELQGAVFAEGAGSKNVLACLPLKMGYETTFRNFDIQKEEIKLMQLEVIAEEEVTIDAGTFDTFKVALKPANGDPGSTTIWVTTDKNRIPVMTSSVVPEMGGAIMKSELLK